MIVDGFEARPLDKRALGAGPGARWDGIVLEREIAPGIASERKGIQLSRVVPPAQGSGVGQLAINANSRLIGLDGGGVTFRYKDYRRNG